MDCQAGAKFTKGKGGGWARSNSGTVTDWGREYIYLEVSTSVLGYCSDPCLTQSLFLALDLPGISIEK